MSEKRDSEVCRFQSFHAFVACRGRTPDDTGPRINDVPGAVHDDSSRRSRTLGIWQRSPSPEHDDLRLCRRRRLGEGCRMAREHKKQSDNCEHLTFASVTHAGRSSCPASRRNCTFVSPLGAYPKVASPYRSGRMTGKREIIPVNPTAPLLLACTVRTFNPGVGIGSIHIEIPTHQDASRSPPDHHRGSNLPGILRTCRV